MSDEAEAEPADLLAAAEALGLSPEAEGRLIGQDHYGIHVLVAHDAAGTTVVARLEPPLQMGLTMRALGPLEIGEPGPLEFATLEQVFETSIADPEHGRRVLGPCVPALIEGARRQPSLRIDDERVAVQLEGRVTDPGPLSEALETVAVVARWLRGARSQELSGWEQKIDKAWPAIASTWGMALDLMGLRMSGVVDGGRVDVWVEPGPFPRTGLRVQIPSLGFRLSISRAGDEPLAERFSSGDVIETGEPELDAFRVVGKPEEELRALLTPRNREDLLMLLERASAVSFEDDAVELWSPGAVTHGAGLEAMIMDARRAADRLREAPEDARSGHGPYRS